MTDNMKKFAELLSSDENAKKEFESAVSGLSKDDRKGFVDMAIKFAAGHGITLTDKDFKKEEKELSEDEMSAVAGGGDCGEDGWFCSPSHWFDGKCPLDSLW